MRRLYTALKDAWFALGKAIGWVNTRIFLTIIYALPLGIYALVSRATARHAHSAWKEYPAQAKTLESLGKPF